MPWISSEWLGRRYIVSVVVPSFLLRLCDADSWPRYVRFAIRRPTEESFLAERSERCGCRLSHYTRILDLFLCGCDDVSLQRGIGRVHRHRGCGFLLSWWQWRTETEQDGRCLYFFRVYARHTAGIFNFVNSDLRSVAVKCARRMDSGGMAEFGKR